LLVRHSGKAAEIVGQKKSSSSCEREN
jgi:hypothetical protein